MLLESKKINFTLGNSSFLIYHVVKLRIRNNKFFQSTFLEVHIGSSSTAKKEN